MSEKTTAPVEKYAKGTELLLCPYMPNKCPPPGIYFDVPEEEYFGWAAVSQSFLKEFKQSALVGREQMNEPSFLPSYQMVYGTAVGAYFLEPQRFAKDSIEIDGLKPQAQKKTFAKHAANNPGKILIAEEWMERIKLTEKRIQENPAFMKILNPTTRGSGKPAKLRAEVCLVTMDPATGLPCKCRLDILDDQYSDALGPATRIVDMKTASKVGQYSVGRDGWEYGYDIQLGTYTEMMELHLGKGNRVVFSFAVVGNEKPFDAVVCPCGEDVVSVGKTRRSELMRTLATALATNKWHGVGGESGELPFILPPHAMTQYMDGEG